MSRIDEYRTAKRDLHKLEHRSSGVLKVRMMRFQAGQQEFRHDTEFEALEGTGLFELLIDALRHRVSVLRDAAEKEARALLTEGAGEAAAAPTQEAKP